jgi:hypothetical protein
MVRATIVPCARVPACSWRCCTAEFSCLVAVVQINDSHNLITFQYASPERREKAAKALDGIVNVGAVDADSEKQLGGGLASLAGQPACDVRARNPVSDKNLSELHAGQYGIQGFPTIKFMYHDGNTIKAVDYNAGRTAKDIISFALDKSRALAFKRIGQKPSSSSSGSSSGGAVPARKASAV